MKVTKAGRKSRQLTTYSVGLQDDIKDLIKAFKSLTPKTYKTFKDYLIQTKKDAQIDLKDRGLLYSPKVYLHQTEDDQHEWKMAKPSQDNPNVYGSYLLDKYLIKVKKLKHDSVPVLLGEIICLIDALLNYPYEDEDKKLADAFQLGILTTQVEIFGKESETQSDNATKPRSNEDVESIIKSLAKKDATNQTLWNMFITMLDNENFQPRTQLNDKGNEFVEYNNPTSKNGRKPISLSTFCKKIRKNRN